MEYVTLGVGSLLLVSAIILGLLRSGLTHPLAQHWVDSSRPLFLAFLHSGVVTPPRPAGTAPFCFYLPRAHPVFALGARWFFSGCPGRCWTGCVPYSHSRSTPSRSRVALLLRPRPNIINQLTSLSSLLTCVVFLTFLCLSQSASSPVRVARLDPVQHLSHCAMLSQ